MEDVVSERPLADARIGYIGYSSDYSAPGDRRRFCAYARQRGISFEPTSLDGDHEIVIITQNADLTGWAARKRREGGRFRLILDLVDGYFQQNTLDERILKGIGRFVERRDSRLSIDFRRTLEQICRAADGVWCSTPEQRETIRRYNDNVEISFDWFDDELAPPKQDYTRGDRLKLVWEGQAGTLRSLKTIVEPLNAVSELIELHVVTDPSTPRYYGRIGTMTPQQILNDLRCPVRHHVWRKADFAEHIQAADVALTPMDMSYALFAAKPENKLVLLWKLGMPVLAGPTTAYKRAMAGAELDMICERPADWIERITALAAAPAERLREIGEQGRDYAARTYSLAAFQAPFDAMFRRMGYEPPR
jgi:hypothetical protein